MRCRPGIYYFAKEFVKEVQDAGSKRLAELSRTHDGARQLCGDVARFAADLDLERGLRLPRDGQSIVVPAWTVLRHLFHRQRFMLNGENYVTVKTTLCCSLGFAVCGADGAPLLVKGVGITADSLAEACAARNKVVAHRSDYVADLVEADGVRDVARAARAAGASPKPMRTRAPGARAPPGSFPATVVAVLKDTDDASPIAWHVEDCCIVIRDKKALLGLLERRGWTRTVNAFTKQLRNYGFVHSTVPFLRHDKWTNPDVVRVDAIAGMKLKDTKKRKAKGTGPAKAPKRTRADAS